MSFIRYRKDIDGLRAFAVLAVFIYHLNPSVLSGGFVGVDIFFVISGYLITRILIRESEAKSFSFAAFYARRIKRILPALFLVLFVVTVVAIIALDADSYRDFTRSARYAAFQVSNFYFARGQGYFDVAVHFQPLLHTWSLAVEEQFYLLWPFLIFLCFRLKYNNQKSLFILFVIIFILSFFTSAFLSLNEPKQSFYMFYTRSWEFAIGGIIALDIIPDIKKHMVKNILSIASFIGLVFSVMFLNSEMNLFLGWYILPCLSAALLIYVGRKDETWVGQFLSLKLWVAIGLISYSLYLWHWPLIIFYKQIWYKEYISLFAGAVIICLSFVLSILSYYWVEQPCRKIKMKDYKILLIAFIVMIFSAVGMKILQKQYNAPWRVGDFGFGSWASAPSCVINQRYKFTYRSDLCDKEAEKKTLLIGDSHSMHYYLSVKEWSQQNNYGFSYLNDTGCLFLLGYKGKKKDKKCDFSRSLLEERFLRDDKLNIVFIAFKYDAFLDEEKVFEKSFRHTIEAFQKHGKKVVFLSQVPLLKMNPNKCMSETILIRLAGKYFSINPCSKEYKKPLSEHTVNQKAQKKMLALKKLGREYGVIWFDAENVITSAIDNNQSLYHDNHHLSQKGAEYMVPYIIDFLNEQKID